MASKGYDAPGQLRNPIKRVRKFRRKYSKDLRTNLCYWGKYFEPHGNVIIKCKKCGIERELPYKRRKMRFCSVSCASSYNMKIWWKKKKVAKDKEGESK